MINQDENSDYVDNANCIQKRHGPVATVLGRPARWPCQRWRGRPWRYLATAACACAGESSDGSSSACVPETRIFFVVEEPADHSVHHHQNSPEHWIRESTHLIVWLRQHLLAHFLRRQLGAHIVVIVQAETHLLQQQVDLLASLHRADGLHLMRTSKRRQEILETRMNSRQIVITMLAFSNPRIVPLKSCQI